MEKNDIENIDLTERQKLFCELYLTNGNATKSASLAGYSEKTAHAQGSRLLKNPKITKYLNILRKEKAISTDIQPEHVIAMIANLANPASGTNHSTQLKALELLAKYFGLLVEKREVTTETTVNVHDPSNLTDKEINEMLELYEKEMPLLEADYEEVD